MIRIDHKVLQLVCNQEDYEKVKDGLVLNMHLNEGNEKRTVARNLYLVFKTMFWWCVLWQPAKAGEIAVSYEAVEEDLFKAGQYSFYREIELNNPEVSEEEWESFNGGILKEFTETIDAFFERIKKDTFSDYEKKLSVHISPPDVEKVKESIEDIFDNLKRLVSEQNTVEEQSLKSRSERIEGRLKKVCNKIDDLFNNLQWKLERYLPLGKEGIREVIEILSRVEENLVVNVGQILSYAPSFVSLKVVAADRYMRKQWELSQGFKGSQVWGTLDEEFLAMEDFTRRHMEALRKKFDA